MCDEHAERYDEWCETFRGAVETYVDLEHPSWSCASNSVPFHYLSSKIWICVCA
jgi:hypothetical protein